MARLALIAAASLEVVCRDCGECQPNQQPASDGSTIWTIEQVAKASADGLVLTCVACDEPIKVMAQSKAVIMPDAEPIADATAKEND